MTWQAHHVHLTLNSDLHCGHLPLGFVARTYPFVPCHIPFFAMVPAAVALLGMPDVRTSYTSVLTFFEQCLRSTPFYISDEKPLFPWENASKHTIERHYLSSQHGVTLDLQSRSAEEGKLFETEVILHYAKGKTTPTNLEGYVFFRPHSCENVALSSDGILTYAAKNIALTDVFAHMRLGGNGTRSLAKPCQVRTQEAYQTLWDAYAVDYTTQYPQLAIKAEQYGPMPVLRSEKALQLRGKLSPYTGRIYGKRGAGLEMDITNIAWCEGWKSPTGLSVSLRHPRMAEVI